VQQAQKEVGALIAKATQTQQRKFSGYHVEEQQRPTGITQASY
jgi:hypothetical protein